MKYRLKMLISVALITLIGAIAWLGWSSLGQSVNRASGNRDEPGIGGDYRPRNTSGNDGHAQTSNQPSNERPRENRPVQPPTNTDGTSPPIETVKVRARIVPVAKPTLDWNLSKADYERISQDPNASEQDRAEASSRLVLDFWKWPGRDVQRLGGYNFDQDKFPELKGFVAPAASRVTPHVDGNPPVVCLERATSIEKEGSRLELTIRVMASREWAQRYFLGWIASPFRGSSIQRGLGGEQGLIIGDVCQGIATDSPRDEGSIYFVRHNVAVKLLYYRIKADVAQPVLMNVVALAQKIDRDIEAQSNRAATWEDLAELRPVIDEFQFDPDEVALGDVDPRVEIAIATRHPNGKAVTIFAKAEEGGATALLPRLDAPKFARLSLRKFVEGRPYKAWLVAYDDSLLFSVAEASVKVKPK